MWDILGGIYFLLHISFLLIIIRSWRNIPKQSNDSIAPYSGVSVIIPVRNEEETISRILGDLYNQSYPPDLMEVIVVNDHSTDNTKLAISEFEAKIGNLINFDLTKSAGKKHALAEGIKLSRFDIIVTTDADCRLQPDWLRSMINSLERGKGDMVFGLVSWIESNGMVEHMMSLEHRALVGSGAALWRLGYPIMANGANLCFRKSAYNKVNGYSGNLDVPSGDDVFLLSKFVKEGLSITYNPLFEGVVLTSGPGKISEFFHQRKRWAGKWLKSGNSVLISISLMVFALNISWILFFLGTFLGKFTLAYFLLGTLGKVSLEFIFIRDVSRKMKKKISWIPFLVLELIYPFYVVFFGLVSNFGGYKWKGRHY